MGNATPSDPFRSEERLAFAELCRRFTDEQVMPYLDDWERDGEVPRSLHRAAGDIGLLGIGFPESMGGSGGDAVDVTVLTEAMMRAGASGGLMAALFTHGIALPHLVDAARGVDGPPQPWFVDDVIRPVLAGDAIAALAVTEPDGGSDVANLRTRAVRDGDHYVVDGAKTYITSGVRADHLVVAARTGGPGAGGVSLIRVDAGTPGLTVSRRLDKMGWRCSDTAELSFVGVRVPVTNLVGVEGGGFGSLARHFVTERLSLATQGYAAAERCIAVTLDWVRSRETFGRPLSQRQVVRHTLVEMQRVTEVARVYARDVAVRHAAGEQVVLPALLAKCTGVEAASYVTDRAVQLFGGLGYMTGTEVERHYRDARILGIGGGATEVMTDLAARLMGI